MARFSLKKQVFLFFLVLSLSFSLMGVLETEKEEQISSPSVLTARDTLRFARVSGPRLSPDGKWVLFTKTIRDMEDKDLKTSTQIWRVGIDGQNTRQMTFGEANCSSPAWFPDGMKIAFLSTRGSGQGGENPKSLIFFMYGDGGEAWPETQHKESIQSFQISPDGTKILFIARDCLSEEEENKRKVKDDAEVVDESFRMSHLWIYDIGSKESKRLTEGSFTVSDAQWSPDSKQIVFVSRPNTKNDDSWNSDLWVVGSEGGKPSKLFDNPGTDVNPRWSPDGQFIAFSSKPYVNTNTWYSKLYVIPSGGGAPEVYLKDFDLDFGMPLWSSDGKSIFWSTGDRTTVRLFSVVLDTGRVTKIAVPKGSNSQWILAGDGSRWVWSYTGPEKPVEIVTAEEDLLNPVYLTDANPWLQEEGYKIGKVKTIQWKNSDGQEIEGVLTYPVDYEAGRKYPLILNPHGGPSSARTESFSSTNQFFAGNGFMVLQPNFRGSSNYGQEFLNANRNYWGIRDYDDCMTGVDYCIAEGLADPGRLICYGWSYGGYMSFWIVTQTDRFKAVSPGAGLPNLYSMYSTTDITNYLGWFFGTPWDNEDIYRKHSPIRHVKNVKSPVLILHGANDVRVPPSQAVEFYTALKDLGKDVTFVRYPREGHGISEPLHQIDRLRRYLFFFAEHVNLTPVSDRNEEEKKTTQKK